MRVKRCDHCLFVSALVPLKDVTVNSVRSFLWLLFEAVSVLLLITCTNIASLLLSRAARRRQEML